MKSILTFILLSGLVITACTYTQKIRDGKTAYERFQFAEAIKMLKKEFNKEKSRVEKGKKAYMIAESYSRTNQTEDAIDWYRQAYDNSYGVDALKGYAYALKKAERYEEAKEAFKELGLEIGSPYEYRREIAACETAIGWQKEPTGEYRIQLADFNSQAADFAPSIYKDGLLVITSDRSEALGEEPYKWTGNDFMDLFIIDPQSSRVETFDAVINTPNNEGTVTFNQDFTEMIFTRCFSEEKNADNYCQLMISQQEGSSWTVPVPLKLFEEENINYGHPSLSVDGSTLYFAAEHPDGWGGFDIYTAERTPDGWEYPQLMGRTINTEGNEMFPFVDQDTLYFASDYHTGMGGLDIFRSYKTNDGWTPIQNLRSPINSGADDFGYIIDYQAAKSEGAVHIGYFTSKRFDGKGNDDIYRYEKFPPPPPPPTPPADSTVKPEPIVYKMILEGFVLEKIYQDPANPNSRVLGRKPLPGSEVEIKYRDTVMKVTVGEEGMFTLELEAERDYQFFASRPDYLNNNAKFSTKGIAKDPRNPTQKFELEIVLDKIFKDKEITLNNIYYNYDKWDIRDDAKPTLDELAQTLEQNPQIRIQLSSHTDCRGTNVYNENLSQKRAQSVVDYLISKGISADRLTAVGYGETRLEVECACGRCTEEQHQANRRTTFKVIE